MIILGGFIPRRFNQWAKAPSWSLFAVGWGFIGAEVICGAQICGSKSLIPDPHRFVFHPLTAH